MIHVDKLTKYYHELCAVDGVNFDIRRGEIVGLLGPNGAGKTTILRMLTCYLRPTSGTIKVKDFSIDDNTLEIKRLIGYLPESAPLYRDMLVYDYLEYVSNVRGVSKKERLSRIGRLAELCSLNEVMHKAISELSKGYKQRVGLAHAMMKDPEILILDEPTSGLDPNQIAEIREIIRRIGQEKTVIVSTHILSEAEATCDRIMIINQGKIVADDGTDTLKQSVGGEYTINISLDNAELGNVIDELSSLDGIISVTSLGTDDAVNIKLNCRSAENLRGNIYRKIKETEWILLEFHQETKSLENIFRELTKEQ